MGRTSNPQLDKALKMASNGMEIEDAWIACGEPTSWGNVTHNWKEYPGSPASGGGAAEPLEAEAPVACAGGSEWPEEEEARSSCAVQRRCRILSWCLCVKVDAKGKAVKAKPEATQHTAVEGHIELLGLARLGVEHTSAKATVGFIDAMTRAERNHFRSTGPMCAMPPQQRQRRIQSRRRRLPASGPSARSAARERLGRRVGMAGSHHGRAGAGRGRGEHRGSVQAHGT
jgi:hypothetical protein